MNRVEDGISVYCPSFPLVPYQLPDDLCHDLRMSRALSEEDHAFLIIEPFLKSGISMQRKCNNLLVWKSISYLSGEKLTGNKSAMSL